MLDASQELVSPTGTANPGLVQDGDRTYLDLVLDARCSLATRLSPS